MEEGVPDAKGGHVPVEFRQQVLELAKAGRSLAGGDKLAPMI
jgi:hypothetical protein